MPCRVQRAARDGGRKYRSSIDPTDSVGNCLVAKGLYIFDKPRSIYISWGSIWSCGAGKWSDDELTREEKGREGKRKSWREGERAIDSLCHKTESLSIRYSTSSK